MSADRADPRDAADQRIADGERLFGMAASARCLNIHPQTLRGWIKSGKVSYVRLGRLIRIPQSELDRLIVAGFNPARMDLSDRPGRS
jgi:excisionase family DNA binding protein